MGKDGAFKGKDYDEVAAGDKLKIILENVQRSNHRFFDPLFRDKHIKLIEATIPAPGIGKTVWEFTNPDLWANNSQNLHGGAQATIFDILTSLTLSTIAKPGFWLFGGVSRTLSVTYLRPAPSDEPIIVECEVVHAGQRLSVIKGVMKRKRDGAVISTCEHNKVNTDPPQAKL